MLEFLNDTLFVVFDGCVFQHTVGIPTSINYASPRSFIHMKLTWQQGMCHLTLTSILWPIDFAKLIYMKPS
jgi:hypothetical protein